MLRQLALRREAAAPPAGRARARRRRGVRGAPSRGRERRARASRPRRSARIVEAARFLVDSKEFGCTVSVGVDDVRCARDVAADALRARRQEPLRGEERRTKPRRRLSAHHASLLLEAAATAVTCLRAVGDPDADALTLWKESGV